jgi:hypothetical protein
MRVDQVGHGPAVEAILGHALFGKAFEVVNLATLASALEGLDTNEFAIASIVPFLEFMTPAKLGPHRVPQELHQLDALAGSGAIRAA